jgi:mRNA interferase RelE/StbE
MTNVSTLMENPRPSGCEKLAGAQGLYRVHAGDYRIVYAVEDRAVLVLVLCIGHRREVYRR